MFFYRHRNQNMDADLYIIGYDRTTTHNYRITDDSIKLTFGNVNVKNMTEQIFCTNVNVLLLT